MSRIPPMHRGWYPDCCRDEFSSTHPWWGVFSRRISWRCSGCLPLLPMRLPTSWSRCGCPCVVANLPPDAVGGCSPISHSSLSRIGRGGIPSSFRGGASASRGSSRGRVSSLLLQWRHLFLLSRSARRREGEPRACHCGGRAGSCRIPVCRSIGIGYLPVPCRWLSRHRMACASNTCID